MANYYYNGICVSFNNFVTNVQSNYRENIQILTQSPLTYSSIDTIYVNDVIISAPLSLIKFQALYNVYNAQGVISSQQWIYFFKYIRECTILGESIQPMNITLQNPPDNFNPTNLNPVDVFNSIGSGFLLVAVPLAVVWAGRHFLRPLFSK